MNLSKESFKAVGSKLHLSDQVLETFWRELSEQESPRFSNYLFYLGALLTISAMTWLMNVGWDVFGGLGLFFVAAAYALAFTLTGNYLWDKNQLRIPAGLLITMAVCMTPLAIYGLQMHFDWIPTDRSYPLFYRLISSQWIWLEIGTILAGCIAMRFFPFPFLMAPISFAAFYLSIDIVPTLFGLEASTKAQSWTAIAFGLLLIAIGLKLDSLNKRDYGFWSFLFGTFSFWGGLGMISWMYSEWVLLIYALINVLMMCLSIIIKRTVLMVFGAIGIMIYLGHLVDKFFADSALFPFILSALGVLIIYLGILYQRNATRIENKLRSFMPASLQKYFD